MGACREPAGFGQGGVGFRQHDAVTPRRCGKPIGQRASGGVFTSRPAQGISSPNSGRRGTLEVDLIVQRWGVVRRSQPFVQRGRWTERVRGGDFGPAGARYRLSFDAVAFHPELNSKTGPYAAVCAQLSVPGQGVFAATQSEVRIRPYSAVRDALESATGKRFFPQEKTAGDP
jgi:hypothetical protein